MVGPINADRYANVSTTTPVNLNDALKEARENRPELRRLRLQDDINKIDIQYFKNQTQPQVDIQSTLATTGLAGNRRFGRSAVGTPFPLIAGDPTTNASAFLLQQIRDIQTTSHVSGGNSSARAIARWTTRPI